MIIDWCGDQWFGGARREGDRLNRVHRGLERRPKRAFGGDMGRVLWLAQRLGRN